MFSRYISTSEPVLNYKIFKVWLGWRSQRRNATVAGQKEINLLLTGTVAAFKEILEQLFLSPKTFSWPQMKRLKQFAKLFAIVKPFAKSVST